VAVINKTFSASTHALCALCLLQSLAGAYLYIIQQNSAGMFLLMAGICPVILLAPIVVKKIELDMFSPLVLMLGCVLLGTTLRVPYILFSSSDRAEFLMFGSEFSRIESGAFWFMIGILCFTVGYCSTRRRIPFDKARQITEYQIGRSKLTIFAIIFGLFGSLMALQFFRQVGIDLSDGILAASRKATIIYELSYGNVSIATGFQRFLAKYTEFPFIIMLCLVLIKELKPGAGIIILLVILSIPTFVVPFLYSSRISIALTVISVIIFLYYIGRLKQKYLVLVIAAIFVLVTVMGEIRYSNKTGIQSDSTIIDSIVGSGNGLDIIRTAGIMSRVPNQVDYFYGESYLRAGAILIPRALWHNKPEIGLGPFVKSEIFGDRAVSKNGWPSGIIGESYLNFGYPGIIVIMFLYGFFFRVIYNSFKPELGKSFLVTIVYAFIAWKMFFSLPSLNFAHGISQVLVVLLPLSIFLLLIKRKKIPVHSVIAREKNKSDFKMHVRMRAVN